MQHARGTTTLKWIKNADGSLSFGDGKQLRHVLGITDSKVHAHHIIPQELHWHPVIQNAAKSQHAFHMNKAENGIPIPIANHLNGHHLYNQKLTKKLNTIGQNNLSPDQAFSEVSNLMNELRAIIQQFPEKNLGEISNLINWNELL